MIGVVARVQPSRSKSAKGVKLAVAPPRRGRLASELSFAMSPSDSELQGSPFAVADPSDLSHLFSLKFRARSDFPTVVQHLRSQAISPGTLKDPRSKNMVIGEVQKVVPLAGDLFKYELALETLYGELIRIISV